MTSDPPAVEALIERWSPTGGCEQSNFQMFLIELYTLIGAPKLNPAIEAEHKNSYVFERRMKVRSLESADWTNFIDVYKQDCFVVEAKQSAKSLNRNSATKMEHR